MSRIELPTMTFAQFLAWNAEVGNRHELVNGVVTPIAPMSEAHSLLVSRLTIRIGMRARPPCQMFAEAGIAIPARDAFYLADVVMTCAERTARGHIEDPLLVIEVLSRSTAPLDRGVKLYDYISIPSVREVLFVDSRQRGGQMWRRTGENWLVETLDGNSTVRLETTDDSIQLAPIYGSLDLSAG